MVVNQKTTGRASSMAAGILTGGSSALIGTLLMSAILAKLIDAELISQDKIGYGIMVILIGCAFLGASIASAKIKRQYLLVSGLSAVVYFLILLSISALFFGGQYSGVGVTALLVICGSLLAAIARSRKKEGRKRRKKSSKYG